ncbi:hypothetical protein GEU84_009365 [Fertoebacter nigrum]|uniref:Uncharacterized protein n=1 Tax=Fertoeibacter niger TaxID=2656921 RepID=A0A8X8GUI4_9RHOB|nr:hypothetical protein [Fertoeibacter niger]NUB44589.1 hypothetical protein [Fertoeibacter niger]
MLRLTLVAASDHAPLAAGILTTHLGLSPLDAAYRLASAPSILTEAAPVAVVQRLAALLSALGLAVRAEPATSGATAAPLLDLAVQAADGAAVHLPRLARILDLTPDTVMAGLAAPEGLVLPRTPSEVQALRHDLRRERGLRLVASNPATALYDLFLAGPMPRGLGDALQRLGLGRCGFSGALAGALDRRMAANLVARFGAAGLFAMNRDFQRFDLFLTAARGVPLAQVADFLATRSPQPRARLDPLSLALPIQVESGLARAVARQFAADYAAIGLETRLRLSLHIRCAA